MPLSASKVSELIANKRTKGDYGDKLTYIMEKTDEPGFDPAEDWPLEFGSKSATTMYQGFRNAAEKLGYLDKESSSASQVDIVQREGHVFILIKSRCTPEMLEAFATSNGDSDGDVNEATDGDEDAS